MAANSTALKNRVILTKLHSGMRCLFRDYRGVKCDYIEMEGVFMKITLLFRQHRRSRQKCRSRVSLLSPQIEPEIAPVRFPEKHDENFLICNRLISRGA